MLHGCVFGRLMALNIFCFISSSINGFADRFGFMSCAKFPDKRTWDGEYVLNK